MIIHYLVIDQNLHGVVPPLDQHQLVGLTRDGVGEGCPDPGRGVGLDPQTHAEGVHLREAPLSFGVHVVSSQGEGELELIGRPGFFTCGVRSVSYTLSHLKNRQYFSSGIHHTPGGGCDEDCGVYRIKESFNGDHTKLLEELTGCSKY